MHAIYVACLFVYILSQDTAYKTYAARTRLMFVFLFQQQTFPPGVRGGGLYTHKKFFDVSDGHSWILEHNNSNKIVIIIDIYISFHSLSTGYKYNATSYIWALRKICRSDACTAWCNDESETKRRKEWKMAVHAWLRELPCSPMQALTSFTAKA